MVAAAAAKKPRSQRQPAHRRRLERDHHHRALAEQPAEGGRRVRREQHRRARQATSSSCAARSSGEPYLCDHRRRRGHSARRQRCAQLPLCRHPHRRLAQAPSEGAGADRDPGRVRHRAAVASGRVGEELTLTSRGRRRPGLSDAHAQGRSGLQRHQPPRLLSRARHRAEDQAAAARHPAAERREDPVVPRLGAARPHPPVGRARSGSSIATPARNTGSSRAASAAACCTSCRPGARRPGRSLLELYLAEPAPQNQVGLYRSGTRVLANIAELDVFQRVPWTTGLPAGNRGCTLSEPHAGHAQRRDPGPGLPGVARCPGAGRGAADPDRRRAAPRRGRTSEPRHPACHPTRLPGSAARAAGRGVRLVRRARGEWRRSRSAGVAPSAEAGTAEAEASTAQPGSRRPSTTEAQFFGYAGPLFSACVISPTSRRLGGARALRAIARDRARRTSRTTWRSRGRSSKATGSSRTRAARSSPSVPAPSRGSRACASRSRRATSSATPRRRSRSPNRCSRNRRAATGSCQGLPGYTFERAPGELWRSRYDAERNVSSSTTAIATSSTRRAPQC